ncbi:hypothetical protein SAMN02745857_01871 [Andreprevotia lacus DSM 23236]|jgi:hypothetical protein|uniref:Uncharacterized protein n=1 Tax=Andreprevotia lacus DSM 23236 TaxID=1121001 RepID=A0A1W1XLF8_9NEIS|nr:hypothetical protein [Andreprevotia lacus]SMC24358.1 hypothetical protein SAMN02745857_01871 [Andreprevotia lacus DSM 23236]
MTHADPSPAHLLAYPRQCPQCGTQYVSFTQYLTSTRALPETAHEPHPGVIESRRLCQCGATLAAAFSDRRGKTEPSLREQFDEVLATLAELGLPQHDVRIELRKVLHGDAEQLLQQIYQASA